MATPLDRAFFAEDAHSHWVKRIQAASESIWILTPQADESMLGLLRDALAPEVIVLTSVRPEVVGVGYRDHLVGLRTLLENQIEVRVTARPLSANVLVCDSELVSTGSQRFTATGRAEDVVTLGPANSIKGSEFAKTLEVWLGAGQALELSLVEDLLRRLDSHIDALETAHRELLDEFEFVVADSVVDFSMDSDWLLELGSLAPDLDPVSSSSEGITDLQPVALGLQTTLSNSRRTSEKRVLAALRPMGQDWDPYLSLIADGDVDMTFWEQPLEDGTMQRIFLERLMLYPLILNPSGRMGFARVGKTRITYVRRAVRWTDPVALGGVRYDLEVNFPEEDFDESNMHLTLRPVNRSSGGVLLKLRFDGTAVAVHDWVVLQNGFESDPMPTQETPALIDGLLNDVGLLDDLLTKALRPFRLKTLGRERRTAETFFPRGLQRLRLFRYGTRSVLAVSDAQLR